MKQVVRLTEGDLHNIVRKSVNRIMGEAKRGKKFGSPSDNKWTDGQWSGKKNKKDKSGKKNRKSNPSKWLEYAETNESRMNRGRMINESATYTPMDLPEILENMADYVRQCIEWDDDVEEYYDEIINTGLFEDSEGKEQSYDRETGEFTTRTDY